MKKFLFFFIMFYHFSLNAQNANPMDPEQTPQGPRFKFEVRTDPGTEVAIRVLNKKGKVLYKDIKKDKDPPGDGLVEFFIPKTPTAPGIQPKEPVIIRIKKTSDGRVSPWYDVEKEDFGDVAQNDVFSVPSFTPIDETHEVAWTVDIDEINANIDFYEGQELMISDGVIVGSGSGSGESGFQFFDGGLYSGTSIPYNGWVRVTSFDEITGEYDDSPRGCTDPYAHNYYSDAVVDNETCRTCDDGIMNGDETNIDCGGVLCQPCGAGIGSAVCGPVDIHIYQNAGSLLQSSHSIRLTPGFAVPSGSFLHAYIDDYGCEEIICPDTGSATMVCCVTESGCYELSEQVCCQIGGNPDSNSECSVVSNSSCGTGIGSGVCFDEVSTVVNHIITGDIVVEMDCTCNDQDECTRDSAPRINIFNLANTKLHNVNTTADGATGTVLFKVFNLQTQAWGPWQEAGDFELTCAGRCPLVASPTFNDFLNCFEEGKDNTNIGCCDIGGGVCEPTTDFMCCYLYNGHFTNGQCDPVTRQCSSAIPKLATGIDVEIFPNPNNGTFTFKMDSPLEGILDMNIFDVTGKVVYEEASSYVLSGEYQKEIQLPASLANGMYNIKVTVGEGQINKRIVIQR